MGGATLPTNLIFVDDVLCYAKINYKSLRAIKVVLDNFRKSPGLEINCSKSSMIFSISCEQIKVDLLQLMGFQEFFSPLKYLGVLLVERYLRVVDCAEKYVVIVSFCNTNKDWSETSSLNPNFTR